MQVIVNVVDCQLDRLGIMDLCFGFLHPFNVGFAQFLVNHVKLFLRIAGVNFPDVNVAQVVGTFHFKATFNTIAGNKSYCDYQVVFKVPERVFTQLSKAFDGERGKKTLHFFHVTVTDALIKGHFLIIRNVIQRIFAVIKLGFSKFVFYSHSLSL